MKPQQTGKHSVSLGAQTTAVKSDQTAVTSISQQLKSNKLRNLMGEKFVFRVILCINEMKYARRGMLR